MEHGRSIVETSLTSEINGLKGIIGELTIANETLKNSSYQERWKVMIGLIANGFSKSRSTSLTCTAQSMIYYELRKRKPKSNADLENSFPVLWKKGQNMVQEE